MDCQTQLSAVANPDQPVEIDLSITVLDLTSFQLHDLESVELPTDLTELDLSANRLSSLDSRISNLSKLKKLSLRQNLIDDAAIEPIARWDVVSGLEELVLRDNKMKKIPGVSIFKKLLSFDVSFNEIRSLHGLCKVSNTLKELYVSKNEILGWRRLNTFMICKFLNLVPTGNREFANSDKFTGAVAWTKSNQSSKLMWAETYKEAYLQSNRLTSMKGFEDCITLEELYLSHNGIAKMEGLSALANLRVLDLSSNKLPSVDDIKNLTQALLSDWKINGLMAIK